MTTPSSLLAVSATTEPLPPLCVDLDGTLILGDLMAEQALAALTRPAVLWRLPAALAGGKARLKEVLAREFPVDAATLPYNQPLLERLQAEKAAGRRLILATAAHRLAAEAVAEHLGLFDTVLATDDDRNLSGRRKLEAIRHAVGDAPFAYAGNAAEDLVLWAAAEEAVVVDAPKEVLAIACRVARVTAVLHGRPTTPGAAVLRAQRPHQWCKNLLVFAPILAAGAFADLAAWGRALVLFAAFCATASGIYVFNDLTDLAADRRHPRKRFRPFASGALPVAAGLGMAAANLGLGLALAISCGSAVLVGLYAAASLAYSLRLKELPLVDVFCLAGLYSIRLFAGGEVTGLGASPWLLSFAGFLFLALALVKRSTELQGVSRPARRGYGGPDLGLVKSMGLASSFNAALVLGLYVNSDVAQTRYATPHLLWLWVPLVLFWQCRLWLACERGYMHDDPIVYSVKDWVSWTAGLGAAGVMLLAHQPWAVS